MRFGRLRRATADNLIYDQLFDAYRFGTVRQLASTSAVEIAEDDVWNAGAQAAIQALRQAPLNFNLHLHVDPSLIPALPFTQLATFNTDDDVRQTIQVLLLYILALHAFPNDKQIAIQYWQAITSIARGAGGRLGTREGDEAVEKAEKRLDSLLGVGWKTLRNHQSFVGLHRRESGYCSESSLNSPTEGITRLRWNDARFELEKVDDIFSISTPYPTPPLSSILTESPEWMHTSPRTIRPSASTSTIRPARIIKRVQSTSSLSTLSTLPTVFPVPPVPIIPLDYFPPTLSTSVADLDHEKSTHTEVETAPFVAKVAAWTSTLRHHLSVASLTSVATLTPILPTQEKSVADILHTILVRDAQYFAYDDEEVIEELQAAPVVDSVTPSRNKFGKSPPLAAPVLRKTRSFVDPTSKRSVHPARPSPIILHTPPTPDKTISSLPSMLDDEFPSMDPVLERVEYDSTFGVITSCATCGKAEKFYPACPKCQLRFCCRSCRVSRLGGGDGCRHVCRMDKPKKVKKKRSRESRTKMVSFV